MKTLFPLSPVILVHLGLLPTCLATCYYPSGKIAQNDFPCNPTAEVSVCCGGAAFGIACLDNKVCLGPGGKTLRGSCTDSTWNSPDCPQFCQQSDSVGDLVSCQNVTKSDEDYCCASGAANCCDQNNGRFQLQPSNPQAWAVWDAASTQYDVVAALSTSATPSSSITSSATASPSTSGASTLSTAQSTQQTSTSTTPAPTESLVDADNRNTPAVGLSTAAQAGIGVGAAAGAALLGAVAYLAWRLSKTKKMVRASQWAEPYSASQDMYSPSVGQPLPAPYQSGGPQSLPKSAELHAWEGHELQS